MCNRKDRMKEVLVTLSACGQPNRGTANIQSTHELSFLKKCMYIKVRKFCPKYPLRPSKLQFYPLKPSKWLEVDIFQQIAVLRHLE